MFTNRSESSQSLTDFYLGLAALAGMSLPSIAEPSIGPEPMPISAAQEPGNRYRQDPFTNPVRKTLAVGTITVPSPENEKIAVRVDSVIIGNPSDGAVKRSWSYLPVFALQPIGENGDVYRDEVNDAYATRRVEMRLTGDLHELGEYVQQLMGPAPSGYDGAASVVELANVEVYLYDRYLGTKQGLIAKAEIDSRATQGDDINLFFLVGPEEEKKFERAVSQGNLRLIVDYSYGGVINNFSVIHSDFDSAMISEIKNELKSRRMSPSDPILQHTLNEVRAHAGVMIQKSGIFYGPNAPEVSDQDASSYFAELFSKTSTSPTELINLIQPEYVAALAQRLYPLIQEVGIVQTQYSTSGNEETVGKKVNTGSSTSAGFTLGIPAKISLGASTQFSRAKLEEFFKRVYSETGAQFQESSVERTYDLVAIDVYHLQSASGSGAVSSRSTFTRVVGAAFPFGSETLPLSRSVTALQAGIRQGSIGLEQNHALALLDKFEAEGVPLLDEAVTLAERAKKALSQLREECQAAKDAPTAATTRPELADANKALRSFDGYINQINGNIEKVNEFEQPNQKYLGSRMQSWKEIEDARSELIQSTQKMQQERDKLAAKMDDMDRWCDKQESDERAAQAEKDLRAKAIEEWRRAEIREIERSFSVPANLENGISVSRPPGTYRIVASGRWRNDPSDGWECGPEGNTQTSKRNAGGCIGQLVVDGNMYYSGIQTTGGTITLKMNDRPGEYRDNRGELTVSTKVVNVTLNPTEAQIRAVMERLRRE